VKRPTSNRRSGWTQWAPSAGPDRPIYLRPTIDPEGH
jgi:hypothetical protein